MTDSIVSNFLSLDLEIDSLDDTFLNNIKKKFYKRKLIKILNKIYKANEPLSRNDVYDYFLDVYNNFQPDGTYGIIIGSILYPKSNELETMIRLDEVRYTITIPCSRDYMNIELEITTGVGVESYNLEQLINLHSSNSAVSYYLSKLNKAILNDMGGYIKSAILEGDQ